MEHNPAQNWALALRAGESSENAFALMIGPFLRFAFFGGAVGLGAVSRPVQPIRSSAARSRLLSSAASSSRTSGSVSPAVVLVAPMAARAASRSSSGSKGAGAGVAGLVLAIA